MEILTPWTGEILALCMLLVLNGRIFWTRRTRLDALSLLGPFSVLTSVLAALAWGLRCANIAIIVLSVVCSIINYRSLVRLSQKLLVDAYSVKFFVTSLVLLIITILFLAIEIQARPVRLQTLRYNVEVKREFFSCGIVPEELFYIQKANEVSDKRNLTLFTFYNKDQKAQKDAVIVFVPDVLAESLSYEPYFILLARKGWTVLSADLYKQDFKSDPDLKNTRFLRRFSLIWKSFSLGGSEGIKKQVDFQPRSKKFRPIYESSWKALAQIARERYPNKKIFVVGDSSSGLPLSKMASIFNGSPYLDLKKIPEYTTPGYGFVAQTNPIFSWLFLGKSRDKTSFEPSWCATQTMKQLNEFLLNGENK